MTNYIFCGLAHEHEIIARDVKTRFGKDANIAFMTSANEPLESASGFPTFEVSDKLVAKFLSESHTHFFFLSKNTDRNINLAFDLMQRVKALRLPTNTVSIFICSNLEDIEDYIQNRLSDMAVHFDIKYVNLLDLYVGDLWRQYKPVDFVKFNPDTCEALEDFNMALVGLNPITKGAMLKIYTQARFERSNFSLDIFDTTFAMRHIEACGGFAKDANLRFVNLESLAFAETKVLELLAKYKFVLVDFTEDVRTKAFMLKMQEAILEKGLPDVTIAGVLRVRDVALDDKNKYPSLLQFGDNLSIYNADSIMSESATRGGRLVNDYYNSTKSDPMKMKNWLVMSNFEKGSNISVADFNYTYRKLIGRETFASFKSSDDFKMWLHANPKKFDTLTRTEHLRWNAYMYANGWSVMPIESDIMVENKNVEKKLHACLVPFDDLDKVSEAFGEDYKKYDADNIEIVFDIYQTLKK